MVIHESPGGGKGEMGKQKVSSIRTQGARSTVRPTDRSITKSKDKRNDQTVGVSKSREQHVESVSSQHSASRSAIRDRFPEQY